MATPWDQEGFVSPFLTSSPSFFNFFAVLFPLYFSLCLPLFFRFLRCPPSLYPWMFLLSPPSAVLHMFPTPVFMSGFYFVSTQK